MIPSFDDLWDRPLSADEKEAAFYGVVGLLHDQSDRVVGVYPVAKGNLQACRRFIASRIADGVARKAFGLRRPISFPNGYANTDGTCSGWRKAPVLKWMPGDGAVITKSPEAVYDVLAMEIGIWRVPGLDEHASPEGCGVLTDFARLERAIKADPIFDRLTWLKWCQLYANSSHSNLAAVAAVIPKFLENNP